MYLHNRNYLVAGCFVLILFGELVIDKVVLFGTQYRQKELTLFTNKALTDCYPINYLLAIFLSKLLSLLPCFDEL